MESSSLRESRSSESLECKFASILGLSTCHFLRRWGFASWLLAAKGSQVLRDLPLAPSGPLDLNPHAPPFVALTAVPPARQGMHPRTPSGRLTPRYPMCLSYPHPPAVKCDLQTRPSERLTTTLTTRAHSNRNRHKFCDVVSRSQSFLSVSATPAPERVPPSLTCRKWPGLGVTCFVAGG